MWNACSMAAGTVCASSLGRRRTRKQQNKHHFVDVNKMVYPENSLQKCRRFFLHLCKNKSRPEPSVSGLPGGDKRDRTADLLNAIQALSWYKCVATPLKGVRKGLLVRRKTNRPRQSKCYFTVYFSQALIDISENDSKEI